MKKFINGFLLLSMVLVVVSSCKKDDDSGDGDGGSKIPTINVVSEIGGTVYASNVAEEGVEVECMLGNATIGTKMTDVNGNYLFNTIKKAGTYQLTFSKLNFAKLVVLVTVTKTDGEGSLYTEDVSMVPTGTKQVVTTDELGATTADIAITTDVVSQVAATTLDIAEATVITDVNNLPVETPTFVITPVNDIFTPGKVNASMPLSVLECKPIGLQFSKPIAISFQNPTAYEVSNLALFLYNTQTGAWDKQTQPVTYANNTYSTEVSHFSTYKIAAEGAITGIETVTEEFAISPINNISGTSPITITTVDVIKNTGYIYTITAADAITTAGLAGAPLEALITTSVTNSNSGVAANANNTFVAKQGTYPMAVTVQPGFRIDFKGTRTYQVETIKFVVDGQDVIVKTKKATGLSVSYTASDRDHTGGSGSN